MSQEFLCNLQQALKLSCLPGPCVWSGDPERKPYSSNPLMVYENLPKLEQARKLIMEVIVDELRFAFKDK